ncbi:MAG TPA: bifunctional phosphopantothenoylcysteine decarboxylase/phosphopantothenate--cysteine ligase CoaBC [Lentisphaeria bacterium]|nr:bifunctional phosphopantothenoylcysteine decarboxylase/phosphopantothenate--cysteine ligase CoaBC [Lentisphaerota bacterium]OQC15183.1 MAG: Coenzyme A biosynthesis bifunctional protein CoaBC [Lentisphaerae bacterium ADurb.Bin082]HQC51636.1 bifunctional phosphopantothenoylcysteine decarboxylase/phosphopantothenate--cysteine ligase CoaBC [Lentisphaeria bacterium]HQL87546.1 bifunctional phosphopantothenoylcysteine decarboxylase/phosphopantothenate--cysteine ligase CoaBC [Lentisphaeria bacterium]
MLTGKLLLVIDGPAVLAHTPTLLSGLRSAGRFRVTVAATRSAEMFLPLLALSALSGAPAKAYSELTEDDLRQADVILLAPVSEHFLAELTSSDAWARLTDNGRRHVLVAPARLEAESDETMVPDGALLLSEDNAVLALGAMGAVAVASPEACVEAVCTALTPQDFAGQTVLLTAGPTIEDADPARFVSNRSTGRMGAALAKVAARRGAKVIFVHGPMSWPTPQAPTIRAIAVRSAEEMCNAVLAEVPKATIAILCAAVADYMPVAYSHEKIKKGTDATFALLLKRTPDILATVGALEKKPFLVGFAAETQNLTDNATAKLRKKNCDMLCANDITEPGCGFAVPTNRLTILFADGRREDLPLLAKEEVAARVLDIVKREISGQWTMDVSGL